MLKCPEGNEADYVKKYQEAAAPDREDKTDKAGSRQAIYFQYQRMMRYRGRWHLEKRAVLPGYIFLSGRETAAWKRQMPISLKPCETPFLKNLCPEGDVVGMSRGIIKNGIPVVTSGPLQGKEYLIRKIDRHKRTAEIEIPLEGRKQRVTVGLEIYEKQI